MELEWRISSSWSLLISSSCRTRAGLKLCNFYSVVSVVQKIALQGKLPGMQFLKQGLEKKMQVHLSEVCEIDFIPGQALLLLTFTLPLSLN